MGKRGEDTKKGANEIMKLRYRWAKGSMRKSQWQDFRNRDGKCMALDCFLLGEQYGTTTSTMTLPPQTPHFQ